MTRPTIPPASSAAHQTDPSSQPGGDPGPTIDTEHPGGDQLEPWRQVCMVHRSVDWLVDDVCRISLWRGPSCDVLHLGHAEFPSQDRLLEFPTALGGEVQAARAALSAAARAGDLDAREVLAGGILGTDECHAIIAAGQVAHQQEREAAREAVRRAAAEAEERRPSRILATARALRLAPEAVGEHSWIANCPGTHHTLMLGTGTETFGCGYCKVKGGPEELKSFVARRRDRHGRP